MKYIYGLACPVSNEVRYIGQTSDPIRRFNEHLIDKTDCSKARWVRSLVELDLRPSLIVLEVVADDDNLQREANWIAFGINQGWRLTNDVISDAAGIDLDAGTIPAIEQTFGLYEVPMAVGRKVVRRWWHKLLGPLYVSAFADMLTVSFTTVDGKAFDVHYLLDGLYKADGEYIARYADPVLHYMINGQDSAKRRHIMQDHIVWHKILPLRTTDLDEIPLAQGVCYLPAYDGLEVLR